MRKVQQLFPLTLTLSLREREQQSNALVFLKRNRQQRCVNLAYELNSILPLPGGEGRGEGELY